MILPFTRMLAGPVDFTPGIFNIKFITGDIGMHQNAEEMFDEAERYAGNNQVNTTLAKQA